MIGNKYNYVKIIIPLEDGEVNPGFIQLLAVENDSL